MRNLTASRLAVSAVEGGRFDLLDVRVQLLLGDNPVEFLAE
jgi:hypothetical protein